MLQRAGCICLVHRVYEWFLIQFNAALWRKSKRQRLTWPFENRFVEFMCFLIVCHERNAKRYLYAESEQFHKFLHWIQTKSFVWSEDFIKILCKVKRKSDIVTIYKSNTLSEFQTLFRVYILSFLLQIARCSAMPFILILIRLRISTLKRTEIAVEKKAFNNIVWPPPPLPRRRPFICQ